MNDLPTPSVPAEPRRRSASPAPLALGVAALMVALIALGLAVLGTGDGSSNGTAAPTVASSSNDGADLYRGPDDLPALIALVEQSVVDVVCGDGGGTGFAMDLPLSDPSGSYRSVIVTNHHVIEECADGSQPVEVAHGADLADAGRVRIVGTDAENDLALLEIEADVPPIKEAATFAERGWWSMVVGNPYDADIDRVLYDYVSIGHVGYVLDQTWNYTSATINKGNSGGPLVNARGELIGVTSFASASTEEGVWNIAIDSDVLCETLTACTGRN